MNRISDGESGSEFLDLDSVFIAIDGVELSLSDPHAPVQPVITIFSFLLIVRSDPLLVRTIFASSFIVGLKVLGLSLQNSKPVSLVILEIAFEHLVLIVIIGDLALAVFHVIPELPLIYRLSSFQDTPSVLFAL